MLVGIFSLSPPTTLLSTLGAETGSVFKVTVLPARKVPRAFLTAPLPALRDAFSPARKSLCKSSQMQPFALKGRGAGTSEAD